MDSNLKLKSRRESECRRGARPQLRARPCESNCRGEVIMVRQGLAAAAGECTGTAGLRRLSPRRLPSALPASMFPPGRLRPRGDVRAAGRLGFPQAQVLHRRCRDVTVPSFVDWGRASRRSEAPLRPSVAPACRQPAQQPGRARLSPRRRGSRVPTSQLRRRLDGVGDDTCLSTWHVLGPSHNDP